MEDKPILFYDGDCAMCNRSVQFVVEHEKPGTELLFAPLQSELAKRELTKFGYDFNNLSTLVLLKNGKAYYRSSAALLLGHFLNTPYNFMLAFIIIPKFIRDAVYKLVSRNRHKWFKKDYCFMPDAELRKRFVER